MSKSTLTKIIAYKNNVFVAKAPNKRIIYTPEENGKAIIQFVRMLSKEEQEQWRRCWPHSP